MESFLSVLGLLFLIILAIVVISVVFLIARAIPDYVRYRKLRNM